MTSTFEFKTFNITFPQVIEPLGSSINVALASVYGTFVLVLPTEPADSLCPRVICILSTLAQENPFPEPGPNGRPRFSMKTYSENVGIIEQLEALGIVSRTGISYNQGFVNIPVVEVCLEETQLVHACVAHYEEEGLPGCLEVVGTKHPRCAKCKQVYYCNQECQARHWSIHKKDCPVAQRNPMKGLILMENRRRAEMSSHFANLQSQAGTRFQVINM